MSSNTYFLALEDALGSVEQPVRMAERMGMNFDRPNQTPADEIIAENHGAFTFGPYATSPLDLASAYNTLAANGTQCDPSPVAEILDRAGQPLTNADGEPVVTSPEQRCTPEAIPSGVATTLNQILRHDVEPGRSGATGTRAFVPGHQIAGKTGTSQANYSVAFVGYTPQYTASVMVLNPKRNQDVGGFGGGKGATIWHDAMAPILGGQPMVPFAPADPRVQEGNTKVVPSCGGVNDCEQKLRAAGFRTIVVEVDSDRQSGFVVGTSPAAGSRAVLEQEIAIQVSNGSDYVEPAPEPPAAPAPNPGGDSGAQPPGGDRPGGGDPGGGGPGGGGPGGDD
jgi:membrane peptidoglycan carboxypeptidase